MCNIFLPNDILLIIVKFLNVQDILKLSHMLLMYYFMTSNYIMKYIVKIFESCNWVDKFYDQSFMIKVYYLIINDHESEPTMHYIDIVPLCLGY